MDDSLIGSNNQTLRTQLKWIQDNFTPASTPAQLKQNNNTSKVIEPTPNASIALTDFTNKSVMFQTDLTYADVSGLDISKESVEDSIVLPNVRNIRSKLRSKKSSAKTVNPDLELFVPKTSVISSLSINQTYADQDLSIDTSNDSINLETLRERVKMKRKREGEKLGLRKSFGEAMRKVVDDDLNLSKGLDPSSSKNVSEISQASDMSLDENSSQNPKILKARLLRKRKSVNFDLNSALEGIKKPMVNVDEVSASEIASENLTSVVLHESPASENQAISMIVSPPKSFRDSSPMIENTSLDITSPRKSARKSSFGRSSKSLQKSLSISPSKSPLKSSSESPSKSPLKSSSESPSESPPIFVSKSLRKSLRKSSSKSPSESPQRSSSKSPSKSLQISVSQSPRKSFHKSSSISPSKSPLKSSSESPSKSPISVSKSLGKSLQKSSSKSPSKSPMKSSTESPSKSPISVSKSLHKSLQKSSSKSPSKSSQRSSSKSPSKSPMKSSSESPSKSPISVSKSLRKSLLKSSSKSPSKSSQRSSSKSPSKSPMKSSSKSPSKSPISVSKSLRKSLQKSSSKSPSKSPQRSSSKRPSKSLQKSSSISPSKSPPIFVSKSQAMVMFPSPRKSFQERVAFFPSNDEESPVKGLSQSLVNADSGQSNSKNVTSSILKTPLKSLMDSSKQFLMDKLQKSLEKYSSQNSKEFSDEESIISEASIDKGTSNEVKTKFSQKRKSIHFNLDSLISGIDKEFPILNKKQKGDEYADQLENKENDSGKQVDSEDSERESDEAVASEDVGVDSGKQVDPEDGERDSDELVAPRNRTSPQENVTKDSEQYQKAFLEFVNLTRQNKSLSKQSPEKIQASTNSLQQVSENFSPTPSPLSVRRSARKSSENISPLSFRKSPRKATRSQSPSKMKGKTNSEHDSERPSMEAQSPSQSSPPKSFRDSTNSPRLSATAKLSPNIRFKSLLQSPHAPSPLNISVLRNRSVVSGDKASIETPTNSLNEEPSSGKGPDRESLMKQLTMKEFLNRMSKNALPPREKPSHLRDLLNDLSLPSKSAPGPSGKSLGGKSGIKKAPSKAQVANLPFKFNRNTFEHFSQHKVTAAGAQVFHEAVRGLFDNLRSDLDVVLASKQDKVVNKNHVYLLMKHLGIASSWTEMDALAQELLPVDEWRKLVPTQFAFNEIFPKK